LIDRSGRAPSGSQTDAFASLADLLRHRATRQPADRAYVFLSERGEQDSVLSFADLESRARAIAARLSERARPGERSLLLFPTGPEFLLAFFGCVLVGLIPVPMMVPRRASARDAAAAIVADCTPRLAMTSAHLSGLRPDVIERFSGAGLDWVIIDRTERSADRPAYLASPGCDDVAFLQYTSGSTSDPKGVMVSHGNLLSNSEMIRLALGSSRDSTFVSWLPLYHDMGLILNVLQTLYVGATCVLMSPLTFLQRPLLWLRAIHSYQAKVATAPNFAFDLCVERARPEQMREIDLASWDVALNGAEPVRAATLQRFRQTFAPYGFKAGAMYPAYGLAEATLLVGGGERGAGPRTCEVSRTGLQHGRVAAASDDHDRQILIGCGQSLVGERLAVVDPETRRRLEPRRIGEIWVSGPNVALGYWRNAEATTSTFRVRIEGEGERYWLRTGDLGFLDQSGELYITGRIKDVVIIRGVNHYPQDIENTVQSAHPALRRNCGAAFGNIDEDGGGEADRGAGGGTKPTPSGGGRRTRGYDPRGRGQRARDSSRRDSADPARQPAKDDERQDPAESHPTAVA
jgi:acyl-CoA synthetase (AMP-forming)/AMP-acid ligase II